MNAMIGFSQLARQKGLSVGVEETLSALKIFDFNLYQNKTLFYFSLKTLFCSGKDDIPIFDSIFDDYWHIKEYKRPQDTLKKMPVKRDIQNDPNEKTILSVWGKGKKEGGETVDTTTTGGAYHIERLRKTDFSKISSMDAGFLEEIAEKLWREMAKRMKRRMKKHSDDDKIDIRKTIRASLEHGGDPIKLKLHGQKQKKLRLVVLLDVSGSMDKYSFFLLRFVYALQIYFEKVESFFFSTRLVHATPFIEKNGVEKSLKLLTQHANNWSSGTKIGECFREFNDNFAKEILSRSSLVIVLSDGLDTGERGLIDKELKKIRLRTKRLIWLNPLKGFADYRPQAAGMKEALPYIDTFRSAHNLESLTALEKILTSV